MCGFAGFVNATGDATAERLRRIVADMAGAVIHRGPDDAGEWVDAEAGVGFGFRRLAIIDLSPAGHQPMHSASDRYVIIFNGEVYNFEDIRGELIQRGLAPEFRGHSDTEVLLAAIDAWGIEAAVQRFTGMFAIALWDRRERQLHLIRDRLGIKPLYYGWMGDSFLFGSELKGLVRHPDFRGEIDRSSIADLVRHNYIPAPQTIYFGVHKLRPGSVLTVDPTRRTSDLNVYWSPRAIAEAGVADRFTGSFADAVDELELLLRDAVGLRMISDVPLGVFLSGGIDSSVVTALMQAQSTRPVKTFSIGFNEDGYDEARHAAAVAAHLGTDHTELYVTPEEALAVIPRLPEIYDEPFADSSQIPTFLVSELARRHVTVALSGDGGDELFAGYNRYFRASKIWARTGWVPPLLGRAVAGSLAAVSPAGWDRAFRAVGPMLPRELRGRMSGDRVHKLAALLALGAPDMMYRRLISVWSDPASLVIGASTENVSLERAEIGAELESFTERMMYHDLVNYLPDDILAKVDRASMAVSLEAREPLLDHRVVEFAWRLPLEMKVQGATGKRVLREVLYRYVPRELIERPKMGFGVPLDHWLRGPLRPWVEALLDEGRLRREGIFVPAVVRRVWREHLSGERNWQYRLWGVLMFQAWQEHAGATCVNANSQVFAPAANHATVYS